MTMGNNLDTDWEPPQRGEYEADARNDPPEHYETTGAPVHEFEPTPEITQEPVPVYDVTPKEEPQFKDWTSQRLTVTDQVITVTGSRRERTRLCISNDGAKPVYLNTDPEIQTDQTSGAVGAHFKISNVTAGNAPSIHEFLHNQAVYARCAPGDTSTLNVWEEFTVSKVEPIA